MEDTLKKIDDEILNYEHDEVVGTCRKALDSGNSPEEVFTSLVEGVRKITKMYQEDDYYLPDFIMAVETFGVAMDFLHTMLLKKESDAIVVGTVKGSVHDSGKNLLRDLLRGSGYRVYDLGVNVESERFIEKIKEENAKVLCVGVYMSQSRMGVEKILKGLKETRLRDKSKS